MSEKLINKIKENYQIEIDKYNTNQEFKKEMKGMHRMFHESIVFTFVPLFMNDLIDIIKSRDIKFVESELCGLYQINMRIPKGCYDFIPEIMEYKEKDGKLIQSIIPNQNAGNFRPILEKAFDYFIESHNPKGFSNLIFYKQDKWNGPNFYIEGLIKK